MVSADRITGVEAVKRLLAIRSLLGADASRVCIYKRPRDNKIVHVSLQLDDQVWFYHRLAGGGSLRLVATLDYRFPSSSHGRLLFSCQPTFEQSPASELVAITRLAFVPTIQAQLYTTHPLLATLLKKPPL